MGLRRDLTKSLYHAKHMQTSGEDAAILSSDKRVTRKVPPQSQPETGEVPSFHRCINFNLHLLQSVTVLTQKTSCRHLLRRPTNNEGPEASEVWTSDQSTQPGPGCISQKDQYTPVQFMSCLWPVYTDQPCHVSGQ